MNFGEHFEMENFVLENFGEHFVLEHFELEDFELVNDVFG